MGAIKERARRERTKIKGQKRGTKGSQIDGQKREPKEREPKMREPKEGARREM